MCFAVAVASAETVSLGGAFGTTTRDAMIFQNNVDNGAGGAPGLFAGSNSQPSQRRGFIEFDLSTLPPGATITNVELRLVIGQLAGSGGGSNPPGYLDPVIGLHRLLVSWGEADTGRSTANVLNGIGQGTLAETGDATWNARYHDPVEPIAWHAPGGQAGTDYVAGASSELVQANERYVESNWPATPTLVDDVQGWLDDPLSNHGWMLINTNETDRQTFRGFFSHDYNPASLPTDLPAGSGLDEVADFWPVLTVTYEAALSGDFDGDGKVDGRDFLAWQRNTQLGSLADWQNAYGASHMFWVEDDRITRVGDDRARYAVPEPGCWVILLGCVMLAWRFCRTPFGIPLS
jgi:hypothetical protein